MSLLSKPTMEFGLSFINRLNSQSTVKNVLLSPFSVILAYGMLLEGADGLTKQQILKTLCLDKINDQLSDIPVIVKRIMKGYLDDESFPKCQLEFGNLLMVNNKFKIKKNYAQNSFSNYFAIASEEDFQDGDCVQDKINNFVAECTHNKISGIMSEPPTPDDIIILMNTIYFQGNWFKPFSNNRTRKKIFHNADGTKIECPMMTFVNERFNYFHEANKDFKIVEIPYVKNFSMILIMPAGNNDFKTMIANLDSDELTSALKSMDDIKLDELCIPKFKLEDNHDLHNILPSMGMNLPFHKIESEMPNIIDGPGSLYVSKSIQKALIEISEKGTIAPSITSSPLSLTMRTMSQLCRLEFIADRPFLFFIRDNSSEVNLFMGQMDKITPQQFL